MSERRFDIVHDGIEMNLEDHFCREWDDSGGCYGTNAGHGFTFEEAKEHIAQRYEEMAAWWRRQSLESWERGDE